MRRTVSPWVRVSLLLLCVAVVGALLGVGWESFEAREQELPDMAQGSGAAGLPTSPINEESGLSEVERQVVHRATEDLPPYHDAVPRALGADYLGPESPIAVAWFSTRDTPAQVLGFYRESILAAGLPVMQHDYNGSAGYVGHVDPASHQAHLVSVVAQGAETLVFVSSGQLDAVLEGQPPVPGVLPMPVGAASPVVFTFRDEGRVRYSVQAEVPRARAGELAASYRQMLATQGWTLEAVEPSAGVTHLLASRGDSRVSALVQPSSEGARLLLTLDTREQVE